MEEPDKTHWNPSRKLPAATIGIIDATYLITFGSLLKAYPNLFRIANKTDPIIMPSTTTVAITTRTANFAPFGFPAPNSFEILVL